MKFRAKLCSWFQKDSFESDMSEEMQLHLEQRIRENIAAGMSTEEARHAALRKFGGVEQAKEGVRDQRCFRWLDDLGRDFRFAFRIFGRAPVLTAVIVLSLGIGMGANTAVFSWIRSVAVDPLPGVRDGSRLLLVEQQNAAGTLMFASAAEWRDLRTQSNVFQDLFAHSVTTFDFKGTSQDVRLWGEFVSANFFDVLGVRPVVGRLLRPEDDEPGRPAVVVISHTFWQTQFAGRADAVGETIRLKDRSFTIVGVASAPFQGAVAALALDVWLPQATFWNQEDRRARAFQMMGRLKPGVSLRQANAEVALVLQRLAETYPEFNRGVSANVIPQWRSRIGAQAIIVPTLATLQTVTFLLLLVVCINTANLLLAQGATRSKEIAIRLSLGAGRARVVRQLLAEGFLLALAGAALGTLVAFWSLDAINRMPKPTGMPIALVAQLDRGELLFSLVLAAGCALMFGLVPALQTTRSEVGSALKSGGRTSSVGGRRRFQSWLVGTEIALTLVILIMAGLFLKSFRNARLVNPGFTTQNVVLGSFDLAARGYDHNRARVFSTALLTRIKELPRVEAAAVATWVPLDIIPTHPSEFILEGRPRVSEAADQTLWYEASRGYFETLQIELIEGRDFSDMTEKSGEPEAVVNTEFARRYLAPGQSALNRRLTIRGIEYRIVGVVRGSKYNKLREAPQALAYLSFSGRGRSRVSLFVRTSEEPASAFAALKAAIREVDPGVAFLENRTFEQHLENAMILRVIPAKLLAVLGPVALALAAIGLYSVLAYAVAQRTHEIGVRMTLGATTRGVVVLVLRQGMAAVLVGLLVGIVAGYAVSVRLTNHLLEVGAGDPWLFTSLPLLLAAVALVACWLPARRAARVDPMVALRCE